MKEHLEDLAESIPLEGPWPAETETSGFSSLDGGGVEARTDRRVPVLVPGEHWDPSRGEIRVSESEFATNVLAALPEDALYRMSRLVGVIEGPPGEKSFHALARREGDNCMRLLVGRFARLIRRKQHQSRENKTGCIEQTIPVTSDHSGLVLAHAIRSPRVRELKLLVSYPVFHGPECALVTPGWSEATGVFYDQPPDIVGIAPRVASPQEVHEALNDLVIDFPFADQASRENFFGLLLTALLRSAIPGNIPFHLVMAPLERTGKSKLIEQVLGGIVLGRMIAATSIGWEEEETEKRVAAIALRGTTVVHLDNIREVDSPGLASLLTGGIVSIRPFGALEMVEVPNRLTFVGSGNNVTAHGEIAKRVVPIFLQPRDDAPERRTDFRHPDLPAYVREVRPRVLGLLLGMVERWKREGKPRSRKPLGGFEAWAATVGGILELHGFHAWLVNYTQWVGKGDSMGADLSRFVEIWAASERGLMGSRARASTLLNEIAKPNELFTWVWARSSNETAQAQLFSKRVLQAAENRPVGAWLLRSESFGSNTGWYLEAAPAASDGGSADAK